MIAKNPLRHTVDICTVQEVSEMEPRRQSSLRNLAGLLRL